MTSYRELCEGLRELMGKKMEDFSKTLEDIDLDKLRMLVDMFQKLASSDPDLKGRVAAPEYEGEVARGRTAEDVEAEADRGLSATISHPGVGTDPFESRTSEIVEGMGE